MNRKAFPKTSNGSKVCAYANCRSNGKNLPKDTDVSFFPFAKPCMTYRNEEVEFCLNKKTGQREHIPSKCGQCSRAIKWIALTGRKDHRLQRLTDITKDMHVCSKHFLDEYPTRESDPLPSHVPPSEIIKRRVLRKTACVVLTPLASPTVPEETTVSAPVNNIIPAERVETVQPVDTPIPQKQGLLAITGVLSLATSSICTKELEPQKFADKLTQTCGTDFSHNEVSSQEHELADKLTQTCDTDFDDNKVPSQERQPQKLADKLTQTCDADFCHDEIEVSSQGHATAAAAASVKMKSGWACFVKESHACFVQYDENTHSCLIEVRVHHIFPETFCQTFVLGQPLPPESDLIAEQRKIRTYKNLQDFLLLLEKMDKCKGIVSKEIVEEFYRRNDANGKFCYRTNAVRSVNCKLFGSKCVECLQYQHRLRANLKNRKKNNKKPISKLRMANNRFLSREQLVDKMKLINQDNQSLRAKVRKLNGRLETLENEEHREMMKFFAKAKDDIDTGTPFGVFLGEQMKASKRKSCTGYKWKPEIIKWCLDIYNKSPTAYKSLRSGGYILLPSMRTMRTFKNLVKQTPGYFDDIQQHNPVQSDECGNEDVNESNEHILIEVDVLSGELVQVRSESVEIISPVNHIVCQNLEELQLPENL